MNRLGLRGRLTVVVSIAAAAVLAALTVAFNVVLRSSLHDDADKVLAARATAALGTLHIQRGRVTEAEAPDQGAVDARIWVYSGSRAIERPRAPRVVERSADALVGGPRGYSQDSTTDTRLYSVPVTQSGRRAGTVVAGISLEPYERTASRALIGSALFAGAVLVLILFAVRWIVSGALRPVARMTAQVAASSERDIDRRFAVGEPRDELSQLAATFDRLLDRIAASLRHEQRFSAELSHELRTPLTAIAAEAELALKRDRPEAEYRRALETIGDRARQLERTLETLVGAARAQSGVPRGTAEVAEVARRATDACSSIAAERGVNVRVNRPARPMRVGVDSGTGERILAPVVENACRHAATTVNVDALADAAAVEFRIADDGPGVDPADRDRIFEPGQRGSGAAPGSNGDGGAGLGLALARRLARAVDGDVDCLENSPGAVFMIRMPLG